jgi:OOP family OmpA-OmpF porin
MNIFKKYVVFFLVLFFCKNIAQEKKDSVYIPNKVINKTVSDTIHPKDREKDYNRWSVNVNFGTNIGIRPFTPGYSATTPNYITNPEFNHFGN